MTDDLDDLDDLDDALWQAWAEADAEAGRVLHAVLGDVLDAEPPQPDLDQAAAALLAAVAADDAGHGDDYGMGDEPDDVTGDLSIDEGAELWVQVLSATMSPVAEPGDPEMEAAVLALEHEDWLTVVTALVRSGPGADACSAALVAHLRSAEVIEAEDAPLMADAFDVIVTRWQALGVVDDRRRLTALGGWGLPAALCELWCGVDADDEELLEMGAQGARLHWEQAPQEWTPELYAEAAKVLEVLSEAPLGIDLAADGWQPFLERVHTETGAAAPAYLLAVRAEWAGDAAEQSRWIAATLVADPGHHEALQAAATEAGDRGDAVAARDLLRRAGVESSDPELSTYTRFAQPATGGTSRNAPCPCGSGRKFKLCCGTRIGHPLEARSSWLQEKVVRFAQQPPQRGELLEWAARLRGEDAPLVRLIESAMREPIVTDAAVYDGGLLDRFLQVRGRLLPPDEVELLAQWRTTRRAAYEVVAARPGVGITVRDLHTELTTEVRERTASRQLRAGDLLLARVLTTGGASMLGMVMTVPRMQRGRLREVLTGDVNLLFAWLREGAQPPHITNTEGHDLVLVEQRWRLSGQGWEELAASLERDGEDRLNEMYSDDRGDRWLRGSLMREGDEVVVSTNSVERAEALAQRLVIVDPAAELISNDRPDPGALRAVPDPVEMTPEMQEALQQLIRKHEERWVDDSLPMFDGRTPREMVRSAAGRRQVEDFLQDVAGEPPPPGMLGGGMDADRIRGLLGLPTRLR